MSSEGKFESDRHRMAVNAIESCTNKEMVHNEKMGIKESREQVRKRFEDIAYKTEKEGSGVFRNK